LLEEELMSDTVETLREVILENEQLRGSNATLGQLLAGLLAHVGDQQIPRKVVEGTNGLVSFEVNEEYISISLSSSPTEPTP